MEKISANKIIGIIIMLLGIVLFLKVMNILKIPPVPFLSIIWPVAIILIGIAFLSRAKGSIMILIIISVLIALLIISGGLLTNSPKGTEMQIEKQVPYDNSLQKLNVEINYGAGIVNINDQSKRNLILFNDLTTGKNTPAFNYTKTNNAGNIYLSRASQNIPWSGDLEDEWNVSLSSNIALDMNLDYGASEMNINMSNLKVNTLDINSGASSTNIIFANYPTKVNIESGMSSFKFEFPKNEGVIIVIEDGMTSLSLPGFEKQGRNYVNDYYVENSTNNIEIIIHSGMSEFRAKTYQ